MQDGVTWGGGNTVRPPHGAGLVEGAVRTHNEQGGTQGVLAHREERFTMSEAAGAAFASEGRPT